MFGFLRESYRKKGNKYKIKAMAQRMHFTTSTLQVLSLLQRCALNKQSQPTFRLVNNTLKAGVCVVDTHE